MDTALPEKSRIGPGLILTGGDFLSGNCLLRHPFSSSSIPLQEVVNGTLLRLVGMARLLATHALCFFLEAVQDVLSAIEGNGTAKLLNAELVRAE